MTGWEGEPATEGRGRHRGTPATREEGTADFADFADRMHRICETCGVALMRRVRRSAARTVRVHSLSSAKSVVPLLLARATTTARREPCPPTWPSSQDHDGPGHGAASNDHAICSPFICSSQQSLSNKPDRYPRQRRRTPVVLVTLLLSRREAFQP